MAQYLGLIDMLNGGGAGRAGDTFEGGPLSGLLNTIGIRPMGYQDRLAAAQPMPRPPMMSPSMPAAKTPDRMTDEELVAMIRAALDNRSTTPLSMTPAEKAPYLADLQAFWMRDPDIMRASSDMGINSRAYLGY